MNQDAGVNQDISLKCENCNQEFVFTVGEQEFYKVKDLPAPKYCLICRGMMGARQKDPGAAARRR